MNVQGRTIPRAEDAAAKIMCLLDDRGGSVTICPSEAARGLAGDNWRDAMTLVHAAARDLARQRQVRLTQRGRVVAPDDVRGAYRIGRSPRD